MAPCGERDLGVKGKGLVDAEVKGGRTSDAVLGTLTVPFGYQVSAREASHNLTRIKSQRPEKLQGITIKLFFAPQTIHPFWNCCSSNGDYARRRKWSEIPPPTDFSATWY